MSEPNFIEKKRDDLKSAKRFQRYKILWDISEASPIIRRYFAMNFFDGILTALGIILSGFVFYLQGQYLSNDYLFLTGFTTAIAIGISGLTGSHLAESAERKINIIEMKKMLGLNQDDEEDTNNISDEPKFSERELRLALGSFGKQIGTPKKGSDALASLHLGLSNKEKKRLKLEKNRKAKSEIEKQPKLSLLEESLSSPNENKKMKKKNNKKTIYEEAQNFAQKIAAIVDGFSPFAGVLVVIAPFLFGDFNSAATLLQYISSFTLTVIVLFLLGGYLAKLSRESILKYGLQMVMAAVFTALLTVVFGFTIQQN
ncbi:MAG: VIT1/CCC1 transporter family protein [Promethearchaeota archaeon]